jgi:hypothetical protein
VIGRDCDCPNAPPAPTSFWRALAVPALLIIVGETCLGVREWIRREHKARIARREHPKAGE